MTISQPKYQTSVVNRMVVKLAAKYSMYNATRYNSESYRLTVECLTVPLWYKQQVTFLNSKFD